MSTVNNISAGQPHLHKSPANAIKPVEPQKLEPIDRADRTVFRLKPELIKTLSMLGYETPTEIQRKAIPEILERKNVLLEAYTGTGKTFAYALPLLSMVQPTGKLQAIVILPTQVLAKQIHVEFQRLKADSSIRVCRGYGGDSMDLQMRDIQKGMDILIATPGRFLDLMDRLPSSFRNCKVGFVVLDEAGELLRDKVVNDITLILDRLNSRQNKPQMILASATEVDGKSGIVKPFLSSPLLPVRAYLDAEKPKITKRFYRVPEGSKIDALLKIFQWRHPEPFLTLCRYRGDKEGRNKRDGAIQISEKLFSRGCRNKVLIGGMAWASASILENFINRQQFRMLITTHMLGQGIDFRPSRPGAKPMLKGVVNFNVPYAREYENEIGRTGRAGTSGWAVSLVADYDEEKFELLRHKFDDSIKLLDFPWNETASDF